MPLKGHRKNQRDGGRDGQYQRAIECLGVVKALGEAKNEAKESEKASQEDANAIFFDCCFAWQRLDCE